MHIQESWEKQGELITSSLPPLLRVYPKRGSRSFSKPSLLYKYPCLSREIVGTKSREQPPSPAATGALTPLAEVAAEGQCTSTGRDRWVFYILVRWT